MLQLAPCSLTAQDEPENKHHHRCASLTHQQEEIWNKSVSKKFQSGEKKKQIQLHYTVPQAVFHICLWYVCPWQPIHLWETYLFISTHFRISLHLLYSFLMTGYSPFLYFYADLRCSTECLSSDNILRYTHFFLSAGKNFLWSLSIGLKSSDLQIITSHVLEYL